MTSVESETSCMQARESASRDMLAVKDAHIAALCTELRGKDRMLQAKTRVCTPPYYSHHTSGINGKYCVSMHITIDIIHGTVYNIYDTTHP